MTIVISQTNQKRTRKLPREAEGFSYPTSPKTSEEAMKDPFAKKKLEEAKATLARCPIPEDILRRTSYRKNNSNHQLNSHSWKL